MKAVTGRCGPREAPAGPLPNAVLGPPDNLATILPRRRSRPSGFDRVDQRIGSIS